MLWEKVVLLSTEERRLLIFLFRNTWKMLTRRGEDRVSICMSEMVFLFLFSGERHALSAAARGHGARLIIDDVILPGSRG